MPRRGFTLLEVVLAGVVGALVIVACLAVFSTMDRVDRSLARKSDETAELARLHKVMQRTFTTLVMSDQPPPRKVPGSSSTTSTSGTGGAGGTGSAATTAGGTTSASTQTSATLTSGTAATSGTTSASRSYTGLSGSVTTAATGSTGSTGSTDAKTAEPNAAGSQDGVAPPPPARFLLGPAGGAAAATTGGTAFQRMEVVLQQAPVHGLRPAPLPLHTLAKTGSSTASKTPSSSASGASADTSTAIKSSTAGGASGTGSSGTGASGTGSPTSTSDQAETSAGTADQQAVGEPVGVRGVFEMVPESSLPDYQPSAGPAGTSGLGPFALIWTPTPPATASPVESDAPVFIVEPVVVARGLDTLKWRAFDNRERKELFSAVWNDDMPAYIEMEVRTVGGLYASWMFEMDWIQGPEPGEAPAAIGGGGGNGRRTIDDGPNGPGGQGGQGGRRGRPGEAARGIRQIGGSGQSARSMRTQIDISVPGSAVQPLPTNPQQTVQRPAGQARPSARRPRPRS